MIKQRGWFRSANRYGLKGCEYKSNNRNPGKELGNEKDCSATNAPGAVKKQRTIVGLRA